MKTWESYWKRFEKTGDIRDYLNYTACTREEPIAEHSERTMSEGVSPDMTVPRYETVQTAEANPAGMAEKDYFAVQ